MSTVEVSVVQLPHGADMELPHYATEHAAGMDLKLEFYSDKKPGGYAFSGDHRKMTEAEMLAIFAPKDGDMT